MTSISSDKAATPRSVLITGAAGGVGRALVDHLAERGWRVFAAARSTQTGRAPTDGRTEVHLVELDILDQDSIARARQQVAETLAGAGLNALVNNAGISVDGPVELLPLADLHEAFAVNVIGAVAVTQAFLPQLRQARGRIVNIGGAAGRVAMPMYGALSASKAALDSISDTLRMELRHQGVTVSYIEPGALDTAFFARSATMRADRGYAADPATTAIYTQAIDRVSATLSATTAAALAPTIRAVGRALNARTPAPRYVVGREAKMITGLVGRLPTGTRDRAILRTLHLDADAFTPHSG
jgi:short-subunit dehydrogenase